MTTTTALHCEATTGVARGEWGFERVPCHASRGLRSFIDGEGVTHYACPALGHMADVVRRFGAMTPEQEAVYASLERESAYFRAHEDEPWTEGELREAWGS